MDQNYLTLNNMLGAGAKHLVYKKDGEGSTIRIGEVVWKNEILQYPPEFSHVDEVLKQLQEFQTKDDDIWLIDYMKSGEKGQSWGFTSRSTARVILGQVLRIATCGTRTHRGDSL